MKVAYIGGAGRLGLPFALWSAECGHEVIISDVDGVALEALRNGEIDRPEPMVNELAREHKDNLIVLDNNATAAHLADLVCIITSTPSTPTGAFSSQYVIEVAREVAQGLHGGYKVINIVSTVMPGETRRVGQVIEEVSGLQLGADFGLVHSPEFIKQGSIIEDFSCPDFVVIGQYDERSGDVATRYFEQITLNGPVVHRMSLESAEVTKTGLNAVVIAKMALANEIAWLCQATPGADARDVLGAIGADSRVGPSYFKAGTWPGGPCFPRDTRALAAAGHKAKMEMPVIEEVSRSADRELQRLVDLCEELIIDYPRVGVLGLAYKPGVAIREESQGDALIEALSYLALVDQHDPMLWKGDLAAFVDRQDLLVLMTCWPEYQTLQEMDLSRKCVVDMWGYLDPDALNCDRYVRFGEGPQCSGARQPSQHRWNKVQTQIRRMICH